jgi:hypothetical protein
VVNPEGKRLLEISRRRWGDKIEMDGVIWIGSIWLSIMASERFFYTQLYTIEFNKTVSNPGIAEQLVASQELLSSKELVTHIAEGK